MKPAEKFNEVILAKLRTIAREQNLKGLRKCSIKWWICSLFDKIKWNNGVLQIFIGGSLRLSWITWEWFNSTQTWKSWDKDGNEGFYSVILLGGFCLGAIQERELLTFKMGVILDAKTLQQAHSGLALTFVKKVPGQGHDYPPKQDFSRNS